MDVETIRDLVVPIEGYSELKRRMLCGELQRFRRSLEWVVPHRGGRLLDVGASGELVPVYRVVLGYERITCLDVTGASGPQCLVHQSGSVFECDMHRSDLEKDP